MSLPSKSPYHQIWTEFLNGDLEICVSPEILLEYEEIVSQKISSRMATFLMEALTNRSNLVRTTPTWRFNLITQDPDDNKFVDCAICGMAEYIVSNDRHFDILKSIDFPLVTVRSIQEFSKELADEM
ncbi:MAG: putative toxin-antitoxin system toxin component, PIN family [Fibrobacter sp.]|nr:putative toxin-antitoxin system toxin component, PIN family [Fibrobacter sp.]